MLIVYILTIICRYFGPSWLGAQVRHRPSLLGAEMSSYLIMHVIQCAPADLVWYLIHSKIVSMIRKYHTHKLQTNPWHHEEEPHNNHETPGRQNKAKQPAMSSPLRCLDWTRKRWRNTSRTACLVVNPI